MDEWVAELEARIRQARGWDFTIEVNRRQFRHMLQARFNAVYQHG